MATREEIEAQIVQAKTDLTSAQGALASAVEGAREMAEDEGGRGHEGIATSYLSAMERLEQAAHQNTAALAAAEDGMSLVSQTQG